MFWFLELEEKLGLIGKNHFYVSFALPNSGALAAGDDVELHPPPCLSRFGLDRKAAGLAKHAKPCATK